MASKHRATGPSNLPAHAPPGIGAAANATPRGCWLILVVVGTLAYLTSFGGVFLLDDFACIVVNDRIKNLLPLANHLDDERPVVQLSLALNYAFGGDDPWGYHLVNLVVHLLAGLALYGVIRRTLVRRPAPGWRKRRAAWFALTVACIWLVHPLQTQAVTYVIQRGESMMGLFYLASLYFVIRGLDSNRPRGWNLAAIAACALGMATKAVMATAPLMIALYDRVFACSSWREVFRKRWRLYAGLGASWGVLAAVGVLTGLFRETERRGASTVGFGVRGLSPLDYLMTQPEVVLHYLRLCFWPHRLCLDYGWPVAASPREVLVPALIVGGLFAATIWALIRRPALGFVGAWFFVILAPTSSFIPVRDLAFEHRMYLSLAAVAMLAALALERVVGLALAKGWLAVEGGRRWLAGPAIVAIGLLALRTAVRNVDYHSQTAMWSDVVAQRPNHTRALNFYGIALSLDGRFDEAIAAFERALAVDPSFDEGRVNLAKTLAKANRFEEAIRHYRQALRGMDGDAPLHHSLAVALDQSGRHAEAIEEYRRTLALQPDHPLAHYNLGLALKGLGRCEEALRELEESLRRHPDDPLAHYHTALCLRQLGRRAEAQAHLREALRLNPAFDDARRTLESWSMRQEPLRPVETRSEPITPGDYRPGLGAIGKRGLARRQTRFSRSKTAASAAPDPFCHSLSAAPKGSDGP